MPNHIKYLTLSLLALLLRIVLLCGISLVCLSQNTEDYFKEIDLEQSKSFSSNKANTSEGEKYRFNGYFRQAVAYATEVQNNSNVDRRNPEFVELRSEFDFTLSGRIFDSTQFKAQGHFSYDYYDVWNDGFQFKEIYLNTDLGSSPRLKVGRQLIPWGQSEYSQILDLANPRDNRVVGLTTAEDVRLPIFATKISHFDFRWSLDLVLIHEFRPEETSTDGNDFDPYSRVGSDFKIQEGEEPDVYFSPEVLFRGAYSFTWGDLALIYANVYDDRGIFYTENSSSELITQYEKIQAYGVEGNWIINQLLIKFELARKENMPLMSSIEENNRWYIEKPLNQLMLGFEYEHKGDYRFAMEWFAESINNHEATIVASKTQQSVVFSTGMDFWRDKAELRLNLGRWLNDGSSIGRLSFNHNLTDAITLEAGYMYYSANDADDILFTFNNNDRLFANIRYSFSSTD